MRRLLAPPHRASDPIIWHGLIALLFLVLVLIRIRIPSTPYFDEVHYVAAARHFLDLSNAVNLEHPPLGKELIALSIWLFGDSPFGWRALAALFGTLALFATMRAVWLTGRAGTASVLTGLFVGSNFVLFVQSRIAMLDVFMVSFLMLATWMVVGAFRQNETARWRLAIGGAAIGAAMACKWNAVPLAVLPGLTFLAIRVREARWQTLTGTRFAPIRGMALWEAALWLGVWPLAVYWAAFLPYGAFADPGHTSAGIVALHRQMLELQQQVLKPHPYQSVWWQWIVNGRAIWYLYEVIDGAQRGIMVIGNPVTMIAGLPALGWCLWAGAKEGRRDCLGVALLYLISMALWVVAPKPVQFYFHYFLPSIFLSAALALAVTEMWQRGWRIVAAGVTLATLITFAFWYPVLSAAPLAGNQSFLIWAWFDGWR
ncbi:phospholipid carrier-dependent glycosyltransferase [Aurantiacibacter xanthus]|uniref:Phospholipid carrier-dependent glycosyltransferase n=1 Tax=Aurantiacibacter xanthus TaxID=1784712 RepID=A0A3A1PHN5_9SPHN|nr:phospholipid carrier-dependent glycosyltransferase [Aurantiacibacter xanthus]RIV93406.1 phospholipid carrier-dependent glycosyltransferase [Aurantiacibacter xanthus]